jgi:hypothetical protein
MSTQPSYQGKKKGDQKEYIPGSHEPIISPELFEKCLDIRTQRAEVWSRKASKKVERYPLASMLVCAVCGSRWRGWHLHHVRRYRDPAKDRGISCPGKIKSIYAEEIETVAAAHDKRES